jgi:hypothetical protein
MKIMATGSRRPVKKRVQLISTKISTGSTIGYP